MDYEEDLAKFYPRDDDEIVEEEQKFNFMDYLPFGDKSLTGMAIRGIGSFMPSRDPRQTALDNFYGNISDGTIQSGLMAGYNPVSGGFLNTITGGKFGQPTTYGLQDAYQKRIDTITKTLKNKYADGDFSKTKLDERLEALKKAQAAERTMLDNPDLYQDYGQGGASASEMASYEGADGSYAGASTEDYGGGEKDGGFIDGSNRRKFFYGGIASIL